jgi:hypothetical protein
VTTFCGSMVPRGQLDGSLRPYSRLSRREPLIFLSSSSSIVLTMLSGPLCYKIRLYSLFHVSSATTRPETSLSSYKNPKNTGREILATPST